MQVITNITRKSAAVCVNSLIGHNTVTEGVRHIYCTSRTILLRKYNNLDYSRVPVINEQDIREQFVRGDGPGGQAVSTTSNCVILHHTPSGIVVRCHATRSLPKNQVIARQKLIEKLDMQINGENSITEQKKRIDQKRNNASKRKREKLSALKKEWKEREGLD